MQNLHGTTYVSKRLGVKQNAVTRWLKTPTPKFPLPIAYLVNDPDKPGSPLWGEDQIPELRAWLANRLNLVNPEAHWRRIDSGDIPGVHDGQTELAM